jgi:hypothetical protein
MATIQSVVEHKTLRIDNTRFLDTGDKVLIDGHFYSDKPVFPALLGALVYWPLYHLWGWQLDYGWNPAYYVILLFTVKLLWIISILAFYHALAETLLPPAKRIGLTALLAVGSLYLSWSSTFNNHTFAASFLIIGFFYWIRARSQGWTRLNLFLSGTFFAMAGVSDMPVLIFIPAFAALLIIERRSLNGLVLFLFPLVLTLFPALLLNWSISGSLMPVQLNSEFFQYAGSPWLGSTELSGISANSPWEAIRYGFSLLIGPAGILVYTPFLIFAIVSTSVTWSNRDPFWREAAVITLSALVIFMYYALFSRNSGGWSYSIRWLVPLIPLFTFFLYRPWHRIRGRTVKLWWVLGGLSAVFAWVGLINPWSNVLLHPVPVVSNLLQLKEFLGL